MTTASLPATPESPVPSPSSFAMTWTDYFRPVTYAFWAIHLVAIGGVFYVGFSLRGLALAAIAMAALARCCPDGAAQKFPPNASFRVAKRLGPQAESISRSRGQKALPR